VPAPPADKNLKLNNLLCALGVLGVSKKHDKDEDEMGGAGITDLVPDYTIKPVCSKFLIYWKLHEFIYYFFYLFSDLTIY
jgi:hypothetical protein